MSNDNEGRQRYKSCVERMNATDIEHRTVEIGKDLFARDPGDVIDLRARFSA